MQDQSTHVRIPARDGFELAATLYESDRKAGTTAIISSATAVPRRFYRHFATALAEAGINAVTYDYRGIGESRPKSLRGFDARIRDWALKDMAGVVDWVADRHSDNRVYLVGHSVGGQVAGLLDNHDRVAGLATVSAQSGYWGAQAAEQKYVVGFHAHVTLPLLARIFGYVPWSRLGSAEDLPGGAALEWSGWCRSPGYLLDDDTLPLERYQDFKAPVLAFSIDDDKWGKREAIDAMMKPYPTVFRRHLQPSALGLSSIGHLGYFRPDAKAAWDEIIRWVTGEFDPAARQAGVSTPC